MSKPEGISIKVLFIYNKNYEEHYGLSTSYSCLNIYLQLHID